MASSSSTRVALQSGADPRRELFALALCELAGRPLDAQASLVVDLRDDVEVDVEHGLMREGAVVFEDVVSLAPRHLLHGAAKSRKNTPQGGCRSVGELVEGRGGFLRNDEGVAMAQGTDVQEREDQVVVVNLVAGHLTAHDLRENGFRHGSREGSAREGPHPSGKGKRPSRPGGSPPWLGFPR